MPAACKVLRECQPLSAASPSLLPSPPLPAPQTPTTRGWARCTTSTTSTAWRCSPSRATRHAHAHAACAALRCAQALPCVRRLAGAAAWPAMRDPALPALSQSGLLQPDRAASLHPASAHTAATPSPLRVHPQFGEQEPASMPEIESFLGERYAPKFPLFQKVEVNGEDQHPIFKWLKEQAPPAEGKRGTVQACTAPGTAGADGNRRPSAGLHGFRHGRRQRQQVVKHRRAGCSTCTWAASRALQAPAWPVCRAGPHACAPRHCPPVCTRTISCRAGAGGRHCLELRGEGRLAGGAGPLALALRALIGRPQAFDAAHPCARP